MKRIWLLLLLCGLLCGCGQGETVEQATPSPESAPSAAPAPSASPAPPPADRLRISEVMTDNGSWPIAGQLCDWVELRNEDDHPVELGGYCLSKDPDKPLDCPLPDITLAPGEYCLLSCERDLSFHLSREGVSVYLTSSLGSRADEMTVPALEKDQTFTAEFGIVSTPTPGEENSEEASSPVSVDGLYISEVVTSNGRLCPTKEGCFDLIELCNGGSEAVQLGRYRLSDSEKSLPGWPLPEGELKSGEYLLLYCTGNAETGVPFALSSEGETLYLSDDDGNVLDALSFPALPYERGYGRQSGRNVYFTVPTPGKPNKEGHFSMVTEPQVSVASGQYDAPFTVTLSGEGTILYTVNGCNPLTQGGKEYRGEEIPISGIMSLRAVSTDGERIPSSVVTWNYMVDPPEYDFDIVMISMSHTDFLMCLNNTYSELECAANIALLEAGEEKFSAPCGISILGSGSRVYDKRSYQISFRARYGPTSLHYKLFENREQDSFGALNLRSGSQDQCYAMMRDELLTGMWEEFSDDLLIFAYRPVNVYLNGQYRGVFYLRERCNRETVAWHDGVDKDSVEILRNINFSYAAGTGADWIDLCSYIRTHDMSDPDNYAYAANRMDMDSAVDFFLAEMWCTNYDLNNARVYRSSADDGKWRFIFYDVDVAFLHNNQRTVQTLAQCYGNLLYNLLQAAEFREKFTLRMGEVLSGPLAEEKVLSRIDSFAAMLDHDIQYNFKRWSVTNTYEDWKYNVKFMKSQPYVGVTGWNQSMIEQYIALIQPEAELVKRAFGQ